MAEPKKNLKIFFHVIDGIGHINACIGLAQALSKRGHQIFFLTNPKFSANYDKYNFKKIILVSSKSNETLVNKSEKNIHPLTNMSEMLTKFRNSGVLSGKAPIDKLKNFDPEDKESFFYQIYLEIKETNPQIVDAIEREKPDLIIIDHFFLSPSIAYGKIPWAYLFSGNPAFIFNSPDIPPIMSGYPSNDRTGWDEFQEKLNKTFKMSFQYYQNKLNKNFGYPEVNKNQFLFISPYMNIYGYPEELDYTDIFPKPDNFINVDAFCREVTETFELPEEFKSKIKQGDKLIYLSLGSIGSIDVDLMKRIIDVLSKTPHKYIISMGVFYEQYKLGDNMWGQAFLPQTKILPLVDMVITHGGNNTITESFSFGKPMLVMPLFADQYDNAQRILEKGFGARIDAYGFKEEELIQLIEKILNDQEMNERIQQAAIRIQNSDSKQKACIKIEQLLEQLNSNIKKD